MNKNLILKSVKISPSPLDKKPESVANANLSDKIKKFKEKFSE